ncbi:MAG: hypothetical protein JSW28_06700, partial [Thermoplasmata archaeon]
MLVLVSSFVPTCALAEEYECPACGSPVTYGQEECDICGEALEWEDIEVPIDMNPKTLNMNSGGMTVTFYMEPKGYYAKDIDVSTVKIIDINGVPVVIHAVSHPTEVGDYDMDGIPDLMAKFDRSDVLDACSPGPTTITVTGEFTDGTVFG